MDKLTNLIAKADFVGIQLKPTLKGSNRIKSFLGGLISLVMMTCILFGFVYFGISMIRRDKPIMNGIQEMRIDETVYTSKSPFTMAVYDGYGKMIHNEPGFKRAIKLQIEYWIITPDQDTDYTVAIYNGTTKTCTREDMDPVIYDQIASIDHPIHNTLCIDSSTLVDYKGNKYKDEISLKNMFGKVNSSYIHYKFVHCDEEADPGCGDYLKQYPRMIMSFYNLNYYIDQNDYENPVKPNLTASGYLISKAVRQSVYVPTQINEIVTDSSFFLSEERKETYYSVATPTMTVGQYDSSNRLMLEIVNFAENIVNINQRRYLKVPELLANMGGFMKAALVIGNALSYLYSDYIYFCSITRVEANKSKPIASYVMSATKSSNAQIKPSLKEIRPSTPTFFEYIRLFIFRRKQLNRDNIVKYLELNYLIDCLLFVEELKRQRENNFLIEQK